MKTPMALALSVTVVLTGCAPSTGAEYFPQARIGSHFEYSVEYSAPGAGVHNARMVSSVVGKETIQGREYYKIVSVFSGLPGVDEQIQYLRWTPEGVYAIDGTSKDKPEYLDTPLPIAAGSSWLSQGPNTRTRYKAVGTESVAIVDRTYKKCLKVSFTQDVAGGNNEGTAYSAPNVGMVKLILHTDNGVSMTFMLEKFKR
jgi:hypothetical protein